MIAGLPPKAKAKSVAGQGGAVPKLGGDDDPRGLLRLEDAKAAGPPRKAGSKAASSSSSSKAKGDHRGKAAAAVKKPAVAAAKPAGKAGPPPAPPPLPPPPGPPLSDDEFDIAPPAGPAAIAAGAAPRVRPRRQRDWVDAIGPGHVFFEEYRGEGVGRMYANWIFACPHHHGCERTMGLGPRNTQRLGALEVLAFLHAWRDTPPGPSGHRKTHPPSDVVREFHDAHLAELEVLAAPQLAAPPAP